MELPHSEAARGIYRTATLSLYQGPMKRASERRLAINFKALGISEHRHEIMDTLMQAGCDFTSHEGWITWLRSMKPSPEFKYYAAQDLFPQVASCSSLTKGLYGMFGIQIGRSLMEQLNEGMPVPVKPDYSNVQEGDLVFKKGSLAEFEITIFEESGHENAVVHVGIATGNGTVMHMRGRGENPGLEEIPIRDYVKPGNAEIRRYVPDWKQVDIFVLSEAIDWERSTDARTALLKGRADEIREQYLSPPERILVNEG